MEIVITERQQRMLVEYFNPLDFLTYLLNKEEGQEFENYQWRKAFQTFTNLIFKYTITDKPVEGLKGLKVTDVTKFNSGQDFNNPKDPGQRLDWTVKVEPILDPSIKNENFREEYIEFSDLFKDYQRGMGLHTISPIEHNVVKDHSIKYDFGKIKPRKPTNESELTEKCWPGYTQKGMKTMFGKRYPNCVKKTKKK